MTDLVVTEDKIIERILTMELVRVTERAAVASAKLRGRGDEKAADQAAVDAMRRELNKLPIDGEIVIGEGERDEAPMLYIGEKVGTKKGPKVDIAVDPLEGTTLCAKDMPGSIAVMAMATWTRSRLAPATRRASLISIGRWRRTSRASPRPRAASRTRSQRW
jgi:fructose-1,6-bisphosphatase II / sedoheptulose-1,7-bisphosphatase